MPVNETQRAAFRVDIARFTTKEAWGLEQGQEAFRKVDAVVRERADAMLNLDLTGVERIDVSCSREILATLIHKYRGTRWFFVSGVASDAVRENLDAAFLRSKMSVVQRLATGRFKVLGVPVRDHLAQTLGVVEKLGTATSKQVAAQIKGLALTACNNRLRDLSDAGLVMRLEGAAESGGKEFVYVALR